MIDVLIIGAGPSGLIAADQLSARGLSVSVIDRLPSPARKFLMAGRGGLNITHSDPLETFVEKYREAKDFIFPYVNNFGPSDLRDWSEGLGQQTFVGTSGRVFPKAMKASPLLRALLERLARKEVKLFSRTSFLGFGNTPQDILIENWTGVEETWSARSVLLAMGGASWPKLGSNAAWVSPLLDKGVEIKPFVPANCGFLVNWSDVLKQRFAGEPLKRIKLSHGDASVLGEAVLSDKGLEGSAVYALSAEIRNTIELNGQAEIQLDLKPDLSLEETVERLSASRKKQSTSTFLRKALRLPPVFTSLLHEAGPLPNTAEDLARRIKQLPLMAYAPYDIDRAISSAGGIRLDEVTDQLMLKKLPGVFVAGEMLDWEAPTGGYLLQACFSMGISAADGICGYLEEAQEG